MPKKPLAIKMYLVPLSGLIDDANFQGNHTLLQEVKLCLLGL